MSRFFIYLYDFFERHPKLFRWVLLLSLLVCGAMASRIGFDENISSFFDGGKGDRKGDLFKNIKAKDRIVVMLSGEDPDAIVEAADIFTETLQPAIDEGLILSVTDRTDNELIERCISFVYDHLPILLTDADYDSLPGRTDDAAVDEAVANAYRTLISPQGMVVGDVVMRDPLNLGTHLLQSFERFNPAMQYEIYSDRLFVHDMSTMLMFVEPAYGMGSTGINDRLVDWLERAESEAEKEEGVTVECIGGPIVAVYNARQIKRDTAITLSIAVLLILTVVFLSFRNRLSIPLIIAPPAFGALFALAAVWLVQGSVSSIAIGAGTVVLGISLSYSIHVISHLNHTSEPHRIIRELASPLTIGCMTTIGAFAALLFTSSALLRDMGLFSVFALVGTTIFCLVFLPHFFKNFKAGRRSRVLEAIERGNGYAYESNRWVVGIIAAATVVGLFFYDKVRFDDDMSHINFMPQHIVEAEERTKDLFSDESRDVYVVLAADDLTQLSERYGALCRLFEERREEGLLEDFAVVDDFIVPPAEQRHRIDRWNAFRDEHGSRILSRIENQAVRSGFRAGAFSRFAELLEREYSVCEYTAGDMRDIPILSEWIDCSGDAATVMSRITVDKENKDALYGEMDRMEGITIVDRGYFSAKMVENTTDDFNYILLVSSLIVFAALLLSYGRPELTLLTFLPMCISWVIILGFMALPDIRFNVVNIILATFIFGIGDDFSIFIMDGLLQEYRNGNRILGAHKTAIFFSAFTAVAGMGVLIFAQHPALRSIALISVLGMGVVVLVSYTIQPLLFRLLVTDQTRKGGLPYTIPSILNTLYCFLYFLSGCIAIQLCMAAMIVVPAGRKRKKEWLHRLIYGFTRMFLATMIAEKTVRENPAGENFDKPAVIIANHQSFIDILLLLSSHPKIVMVTNSWVWNSPFFGRIVRYADFYHAQDGYENLAARLRPLMAEGYSVAVFPEGTRSADCRVQRFHKGAFYLASLLETDILPVVLYGTGQVSSKRQGFYIKRGYVVSRIMPRVKFGDRSFGSTYQEQAKSMRKWFAEQYSLLNDDYGRTFNPYFRETLIKNYIYKEASLELLIRRECRRDGFYDCWDRTVPRRGAVTEIGCGYGQLSFMLGLLSPERVVTGIESDAEKSETARHTLLCGRSALILCADIAECELPQSDAFLFNRSLRGMSADARLSILRRAAARLCEGGMIAVRDDASAAVWLQSFADSEGFAMRAESCGGKNTEPIYVFEKWTDTML
ncbi:MAG: 1-acyl-sn-glycerol-3-phosphate acyltransferase [Alistipes sp.]|nr:1-acyl-sn-glycerol-3-phosphate acyltransferase [Alistipes sp.]